MVTRSCLIALENQSVSSCRRSILVTIMQAETYFNAEQKIWSGARKKDVYGPDMTLGEVALLVLSRAPEKVVQVCDCTGIKLTAAQLIRDSKLVARKLLRMGLKPGDVVGLIANNTSHITAVMMGAFLCGTPTNALYPGFDKDSIELVFKVTKPRVIFCDVDTYEVTKAAMNKLNADASIFLVNGKIDGVPDIEEILTDDCTDIENMTLPCTHLTGDDTAAIYCSSGTSGPPKGVLLSHRTILNMDIHINLPSDSVLFCFSTLYWATGLWNLTGCILYGAKRVITTRPFTPEYLVQLIETHQISHVITGPQQMAMVALMATPELRARLASIKIMYCGGSKVPQVVSEKIGAILGDEPRPGLTVGYGMSEMGGMITRNDGGPGKRRDGTEGKLTPNTEVRIVGKDDERLGANEIGMLHIRTPYKWQGYYLNPESTAKASTPDGWFVSGDLGYFDDDGFLHLCSRDSDVFKTNSFQIYPAHIEEVVMRLPGVLEACVFGLPDFVSTNLTACAVVRANTEAGAHLTSAEVTEYVRKNMASVYQLHGGVYIVDALPKTPSGKVLRRRILDVINMNV